MPQIRESRPSNVRKNPVKETGEPMRKFRILAGVHHDHTGTHLRGQIVESTQDLVALHGKDKFFPLFPYGTEFDETEATLYETEVGQETADEIAARVRAQVLAEIAARNPEALQTQVQCTKFGDCLRPNGHMGACAFARVEADRLDKPRPVQNVNPTPITAKPTQSKATQAKAAENVKAKALSNTGPAPVDPHKPTITKSSTSAYDPLTDEELKGMAADEEVDISNCKNRDEIIKALMSVK
jgi:hypothetical protein